MEHTKLPLTLLLALNKGMPIAMHCGVGRGHVSIDSTYQVPANDPLDLLDLLVVRRVNSS